MRRIQCSLVGPSCRRRPLSVLLLCGLLSACGLADEEADAKLGLVEGFAGLVAADDPRATVVGRDVLGNGGNAADAAVAMYFTLAVTLPSRASLGGGGVCVAFDRSANSGETLEFLPRQSAGGGLVPIFTVQGKR